jgi:hypothetical protein
MRDQIITFLCASLAFLLCLNAYCIFLVSRITRLLRSQDREAFDAQPSWLRKFLSTR